MKSTNVKIGFLLAVVAAVFFAGCKPLTKDDVRSVTKDMLTEQHIKEQKAGTWEALKPLLKTEKNDKGIVTADKIKEVVNAYNVKQEGDAINAVANEYWFNKFEKPDDHVYYYGVVEKYPNKDIDVKNIKTPSLNSYGQPIPLSNDDKKIDAELAALFEITVKSKAFKVRTK